MAQSQKSADVKHISLEYPLRAKSGNWPTVANLSGKTSCFGVMAQDVAQGVRFGEATLPWVGGAEYFASLPTSGHS